MDRLMAIMGTPLQTPAADEEEVATPQHSRLATSDVDFVDSPMSTPRVQQRLQEAQIEALEDALDAMRDGKENMLARLAACRIQNYLAQTKWVLRCGLDALVANAKDRKRRAASTMKGA